MKDLLINKGEYEYTSNRHENKRRAGNGGSPKRKKIHNIPSSYRVTDTNGVVPTTSSLTGRVIVVEPSSHPKYKDLKAKLEQIVVSFVTIAQGNFFTRGGPKF